MMTVSYTHLDVYKRQWLFLGNDQIIYSTKSYLSGVYVSPDGAFNFANATLAQ